MRLLINQKNEIFDAIENFKLSSLQFSYTFNGAETEIIHLSSKFYFKMKTSREYFCFIQFSPGNEKFYETYDCATWKDTLIRFSLWLHNLKRETEIEDKWSRLEQEIKNIHIPFKNDDSKFSFSEFEFLKSKINSLKTDLLKVGLRDNKNEIIINKLDYLIEQAKIMNKFDWKSLFVGSFVSLIIQLSISHEHGIEIWKIIKHAFNNYLLP